MTYYTHNTKGAQQKGFSLVETLVGLTIFVTAYMVLVRTSGNSLSDINLSKQKLTAQYLVEEGIDMVKQRQKTYLAEDSLGIPNRKKSDFLSTYANGNCETINGGCDFYIDSTGAIQVTFPSLTPYDQMLVAYKQYEYGLLANDQGVLSSSSSDSPYTRVIYIDDIPSQTNSEAIKVTSLVCYRNITTCTIGAPYSVSLSTILHFNF